MAAAQLANHPLQRGVGQLVGADRPVVVVLDQFGRFGGQPGRVVDEAVAEEFGQLGGVAAEPDAGAEDDRRRTARPRSALPSRGVRGGEGG